MRKLASGRMHLGGDLPWRIDPQLKQLAPFDNLL